jgi:hypothetical protein
MKFSRVPRTEGRSRGDAARREFGNFARIEESGHEAWMWPRSETLLADIKFAFRKLRHSPAFALTAILSLALGIVDMNRDIGREEVAGVAVQRRAGARDHGALRLVPALRMATPEISQVMQSNSSKAAGSVRGKRLHCALVGTQIALTLVLLTAAGAAVQSFVRLMRIPLGNDPHVVSVGVPMEENSYTTWQARVNYFEQLRASVAALPDVTSAAISTNATPPNGSWGAAG